MTHDATLRAMTRAERVLLNLVMLNFALFFGVALALGGDAVNGTVRDGHYYLMNHGKYTEVSRAVFRYSMVHTISVFVSFPLAWIASVRGYLRARRNRG